MRSIIIRIFRLLSKVFTKVIFQLEVRGVGNIPSRGGVLIVSNHVSYLDSMVISTAMNREVGFVMAAKVYYHPLLHWAFKRLPMVPIESGKNKSYLDKFNENCQDKINEGSAVCIYAEGQISNNGHLLEFKKGVEYISKGLKPDVSILPIHIDGLIGTPLSYDNHNKKTIGFRFKNLFKKVVVTFGKPMSKESTVFEVRQKVKELEVYNFSERIPSDVNLITYLNKNNKNWSDSSAIGDVTTNELWKRANAVALKYQSEVESYGLIGVCVESLESSIILNVALTLLGKQVVNFQSGELIADSEVEVIISDKELNDDFILFEESEFLWNGMPIKKRCDKNARVAKFYSKDSSFSMSHENLLAYLFALKQLFELGGDSAIYCQYSVSTAIGYFLKVWTPFLANTTVIEETNAFKANVLVGDVFFINDYHRKYGTEHLKVVILLDGNKGALLKDIDDVIVYQGLSSKGECAVVTLSSPDYEGKSIAGKSLLQEGRTKESMGKPFPGVTIKIVDERGVEEVCGSYGNVLVKGVMFNKDGWIDTGVVGKMTNAGFLVA